MSQPWTLMVALAALCGGALSVEGDGTQHLTRCIRMAEPLVKSPDYIFPLTTRDIEAVCKLWENFVYCVKEYAMTHLTAPQQREFYQVIDSSIKSANELCMNDPEYMRAYMGNAPCLRRVSTNSSLCGGQYRYMADVVQGLQATDAQVCCAHLKFRECVLQRTPRECDGTGGAPENGPPSHFMRTLLDRALGYLLQKCQNFVPNSRDCPPGNFEALTTTTTIAPDKATHMGLDGGGAFGGAGGSVDSGAGSSGDSHNHLGPATPSGVSSPTHSSPHTPRFTWTTPSTSQVTSDPSLSLAGNSLYGAESQQYRGSGKVVVPSMTLLSLFIFLLASV
ncbi:hypothetical protein O3P69_003443 [Scylla paramamosain]|uniref:Uncharacterized protein n=1 Tax=Scylla paramamosain TaxID=85552 RepID=A0AAW0UI27_SCYPA